MTIPAIPMNKKSTYTEYTVNSPTTDFAIGFGYTEGINNIIIRINDVPIQATTYSATLINPLTVKITPAVPSGIVRISRETDIDENLNKFSGGALFTATTIDQNFQQIRNSQQELRDETIHIARGAIIEAKVDAEVIARGTADSTLQSNINAEATTRTTKDNALDARIDSEIANRALSDSFAVRFADVPATPLPNAAARGGKLLAFDASGQPVLATSTTGVDAGLRSDLAQPTGSSLLGFLQAGDNAVARTLLGKTRERVTPMDFGAVGDGVTDDTLAIQRMFASGRKSFDFLDKDYKISLTEGTYLYKFTNQNNIRIFGTGRLIDSRTYTTGALTIFVWFDNCKHCSVDLNYEGTPIVNKSHSTLGVGYTGLTWVNLSSACSDISVKGSLNYLRYGVRSGDYTNPALGYNANIRTHLDTVECGYPIAHYLADDIQHYGYAVGSHRAAYCAGVKGGKLELFVKDNYIAPTLGVLISDATTNGITGAGGASRGSSNLDVRVSDMGSTTFVPTSWLVTISPSRVDAGTVYENININANLVGTDTICTTVGIFALYSAVNSTIPGFYPYNWEDTITIRNIKVSGTLDRRLQTLPNGNTSGELYVYTVDGGGHAATVDGITFEDLNILNGSGSFPRALYCVNPTMSSPINFNRVNFSNYPLLISNSTTVPTNITNSVINSPTNTNPSDTTLLHVSNTNLAVGQPLTNTKVVSSSISGAGITTKLLFVDVTLSGASVTVSPQIPAGAIVLGVSATIKTAITGSTGYQLGTSANTTLFADHFLNTVGSSITPINSSSAFTSPLLFKAYTSMIITSRTSNFTGGVLRICVAYMLMTAPT